MTKLEHARKLRADTERHYNCCQSSFIPFCGELGLDEETAYKIASNFGSGMRHGSTCGAVTGVLMALGLAGKDEKESAELLKQFREKNGALLCPVLLETRTCDKKTHCDTMVFDAVELGDALMK